MDELVRVTDDVKPRREYNLSRSRAESTPGVKILDKPARHKDGSPIPPKYTPKNSVAKKATVSKAAAEPADNQQAETPATDHKE